MIKILPDNEADDIYFYEVMFTTGARPFSETDSNVNRKKFIEKFFIFFISICIFRLN